MQVQKIFIVFILLVFTFSCNQKKNSVNKENTSEEIISNNNKPIDIEKEYSLLSESIDVQKIKSQLNDVTTTLLSKDDIMHFPNKVKNNFYGSYTLIKKNSKGNFRRIGNMVVYDSINPHVYEKETDEFIEITLNKPGINLFDGKLKIGMSLAELIKMFGEDYLKKNNSLIFLKNNKIAFFKIDNNLVTKIKIGVYKNGIDPNMIIDNSKW